MSTLMTVLLVVLGIILGFAILALVVATTIKMFWETIAIQGDPDDLAEPPCESETISFEGQCDKADGYEPLGGVSAQQVNNPKAFD